MISSGCVVCDTLSHMTSGVISSCAYKHACVFTYCISSKFFKIKISCSDVLTRSIFLGRSIDSTVADGQLHPSHDFLNC